MEVQPRPSPAPVESLALPGLSSSLLQALHQPAGRKGKQTESRALSSAWTSVKPLFLHKHAPLYLLQCGNSSPALGEGLGPERPIKADTHGKPAERASGEARGAHRAFGGRFTIRIQRTLSWKHSETEVPWSAEVLMMLCKGGI